MTIDINNLTQVQGAASADSKQVRPESKEPTSAQAETGRSSTADTISLSDTAVHMGKITESLVETPVVDTQRVEQIKQAIADGSYKIAPEQIADKFMQLDDALGGKS